MNYDWRDMRKDGMHELAPFEPEDPIERLERRAMENYDRDMSRLGRWSAIAMIAGLVAWLFLSA